MVEKYQITIPELSGDKEREILIYLPTDYYEDEHHYYPVLYMFDGQNLFDKDDSSYGQSWGLSDYLDFTDTPIIIASIACHDGPNGERMEEYSPFDDEDPDYGFMHGKGKITMDWIVNEFKPFMDENYRTVEDRAYTFIGGSSMGAHMSLYAIMAYNETFSKAAALSPTLWFGHDDLMKLLENSTIDPYTEVYIDYGTEEFDEYQEAYNDYATLVNILTKKQVILTSRLIPDGIHSEGSWNKQIPFFMSTLLYGLNEVHLEEEDYEENYEEDYEDEFEEE